SRTQVAAGRTDAYRQRRVVARWPDFEEALGHITGTYEPPQGRALAGFQHTARMAPTLVSIACGDYDSKVATLQHVIDGALENCGAIVWPSEGSITDVDDEVIVAGPGEDVAKAVEEVHTHRRAGRVLDRVCRQLDNHQWGGAGGIIRNVGSEGIGAAGRE